jgi:hypothetical protein
MKCDSNDNNVCLNNAAAEAADDVCKKNYNHNNATTTILLSTNQDTILHTLVPEHEEVWDHPRHIFSASAPLSSRCVC